MIEPLTRPQREFLRAASKPEGIKARGDYPPVAKLRELGFVESTGSMVNWRICWKITDAGRERLKKVRTRRR